MDDDLSVIPVIKRSQRRRHDPVIDIDWLHWFPTPAKLALEDGGIGLQAMDDDLSAIPVIKRSQRRRHDPVNSID